MNKQNVIAFILGLMAAFLLWYYYLGPKYNIRRGDAETMRAIYQADMKALDEASNEMPGMVLFKSTDTTIQEPRDENAPKDDILSARSMEQEELAFASRANRPPTLYEIAAAGDKKNAPINIGSADLKVKAKIEYFVPETIEPAENEEGAQTSQTQLNRVTMIVAPVKYHLIKDNAAFNDFKKQFPAQAGALPKVDFNKEMVIFLESDSKLSNAFFEIDKTDSSGEELTVFYRVKLIGAAGRDDFMPYKVIPRSSKKVVLNQVK